MAVNPRIKFRVGDLYETREWFWLVYPTKSVAARGAWPVARGLARTARGVSAQQSKLLNCRVTYVEPGAGFMVLSVDGEYLEVLFPEQMGWINVPGWAKKNIVQALDRHTQEHLDE